MDHLGPTCTLRNFSVRQEQDLGMTITESLLATLTTPPLFTSFSIQKHGSVIEYTSGDFVVSNPTRKIISESRMAFGSETQVSCIINLGCGHAGVISIPEMSEMEEWHKLLANLARNSEQSAHEIQTQIGTLGIFHRLSVSRGLGDRADGNSPTFGQILSHTEVYLTDSSVTEKVDLCVDAVKTRLGVLSLGQLTHYGGSGVIAPSLPPLTANFVMRNKPWEFIRKAIFDPRDVHNAHGPRILVVTGMGGCGKTQLILKFLLEHANRFSFHLFVDGSNESRIRAEIVQHVRSLGLQHAQKTFRECLDFLALSLFNGPPVIIYDNVDDPNLDILPLLPEGNECVVLITSRNHSIGELSPEAHLELDVMSMDEAIEVLLHPPNPSSLSADEAREVAQLLGCLPIALAQARSYMYQTRCSGEEYLEILKENRDELLAEPVKYQRDMRYPSTDTAFSASFKQLTQRDQRLLYLLSFFHWTNWPLNLVTFAAKHKFSEYEIQYSEHGEDFIIGKTTLENIFYQGGKWSLAAFNKAIISLQNYSLVTISQGVDTRVLQMHPLTHAWVQSRISEVERPKYQATAVLLLALGARIEHTPLVRYLPNHVVQFSPILEHLHINNAGAFGLIMENGGLANDALLFRERVVSQLRSRAEPRDVHLASSLRSLAITYHDIGRLEEARILQQEVLDLRKEILGDVHPDTISAMNNLSNTYGTLGRTEESTLLQGEVLRLRKKILGERHPDTVTAMSNLAIRYRELGRMDQSRVLKEEVLRLRKEILGERHPDTVSASSNLATTYNDLGRFEEARQLHEGVLRLRKDLLGERHPDTITASSNLSNTYRDLGRINEARVIQEEVLRLRKEILGERHLESIDASNNLANTYGDLGRRNEAIMIQEEVFRLRKEILGEKHPDTFAAMGNLAIGYDELGRLDEARLLQEEVLRLREEILGEHHPATITASSNLANTYRKLNRLNEARTLQEEVLRLRKGILGERHPDTISSLNNLATTYHDLGQLEDARVYREQVLQLRKEVQGDRHPDTISASNNLAMTYSDLGRLEEARTLQEEVCRLRKEIFGERHPSTLNALNNLANTYSDLGRQDEARVLQEEVLQLRTEVLGERHPDTVSASNNLANTYRNMGRFNEAKTLLEEVLLLRREILGERHPDTIDSSNNLANTYANLGKLEAAKALHEECIRLRKEVQGERHPDIIVALSNLAILLGLMKEFDQAKELEEEVVLLSTEVFGERHPKTVQAMISLSITCCDLSDISRAATLVDAAEIIISQTSGTAHPQYQLCQSIKSLVQKRQNAVSPTL